MKKRFLSLLLLCVLLVSCLCTAAFAAVAKDEVHAAESVADVVDLIDGVKSTYIPDYTYFVAQSAQKWVGQDNMDGEITEPCDNRDVLNSHGRFGDAWQSNGFARFVFYRVFGEIPAYDYHCNSASLHGGVDLVARYASKCKEIRGKTDGVVNESNLKDLFSQAKIGDIIVAAPNGTCFLKGTSMIFLEATDGGVKVYQADYTGACAVTETTIPYATMAKYHCVSLLRAENYPTEEYLVPEKVAQVTLSSDGYAHNENVTITWLPTKYAFEYQVELLNKSDQVVYVETVTETALSLTGMAPGTYRAQVTAVNDKGSSDPTCSDAFTVYPLLTVTFLDHDDTLITTQQVPYGGDATAPTVPVRIGYKFAGWDEGLKNIKSDTEIHALYELEKYTVTFYSVGKATRLQTQQVPYGEAATLPKNIDNSFGISDGYEFAGWHIEFGSDGTDYNCVNGDMTIIATQLWSEDNLPISISLSNATLQEDGHTYTIDGIVANRFAQPVSFKLLATMKTAEGKAVKCVIMDEYTLDANASATIQDTIIYSEKITSIEYVAVGIRDNDKTGGAYSTLASVGITAEKTWGNWSEWTETPEEGHDAVETKTQYRYRNKVTAESSTKDWTDPWTYSHETYVWSAYGSWSSWRSSVLYATDAMKVQTRTAYRYFYYKCPYCGGHSYYNQHATWAGGCGKWIDDAYYKTTWGPAYSTAKDFHGTGRNYTDSSDVGRAYCWRSGAGAYSQTQYRYATRYKIYTYHYWKWGEWSDWSDTYIAGDGTEARTLYRYRDEVDLSDPSAGTEDTSGSTYSLQGNIQLTEDTPTVLEGRRATVMVYKKTNTDPTEAQLEYVGQITIGADNTYDITFKPKEDPSEETGDFIVALGIEGCDKLVNIDTIHPEGIVHNVRFYVDGQLYAEQEVVRGEAAEQPDIPEKEGYAFVKWSEATTAVQTDLVINALFQPVEHTITFIDWETGAIQQQTVLHNEAIPYPQLETVSGYFSRKWNTQDTITVATENLIVETVAELKEYIVTFRDGDTVISTQTVLHGQSAQIPAVTPVSEGQVFSGWLGECASDYITRNVTFRPTFVYAETVAAPEATATTNADGTTSLTLSCNTDGATIYYVVETHGDDAILQEAEEAQAIEDIRLDLLQAEVVENLSFDVVVGGGIFGDLITGPLYGATGPMDKSYDFTENAITYNGETIILGENQTIVFLAAADGMNDSVPQLENGETVQVYFTGNITKNTLRQYKETVEGDLCLTVDSATPLYKEGQFTLCLYDERGILVDLVPLTAILSPGSNEILFEDILVPTTVECATGKIVSWLSDGGATPILDVKPFNIK